MDTEICQEQELRACTSNREVDENDGQQILLGPNHSAHSNDGRQFIEFNSGKTSAPQVSRGSRIPRLGLKLTTALLGMLLLVFISLYGMAQRPAQRNQTNVHASSSASKAQQPNLCTSEACISASKLLQSSIDPTANPCQDFYSFACGGFQKSHPFTAETVNSVIDRQHQAKNAINGLMFELMYYKHLAKSDDAELNELFQTARYFYMTCMNTVFPGSYWSSQSELLPKNWKTSNRYTAQELFSSPLIAYLEGFDTVEDFVARLVMSGSSGLLGLDVKAAEKNMLSSNSGRLISFAALRFSNFHSGNASVQIKKIRMQCRLLGLKLTAPVEQLLTVESEMRATRFIMMLELRGSGAKTEQRPQTAVQLDLKTPWQSRGLRFRWTKFVTRLSALSGCKQIKQARIVIKGFSKLISLLRKLEPQVRARRGSYYDFIRLQAVLSASAISSSSNFGQEFYKSLISNRRSTIESILEERSEVSKYSETCMNISVNSMPLVVLEMFRSAYVNDSFDTVDSMTRHVQQAMEQNARNEAWISAENKRKIQQKLSGMRREFFLKRRELSGLKETYREIANRVKLSRTYGDILLALKDVAIRNELVFMTDKNPLESATMVLSDIRRVNAFYFEPLKSILIPPGILHTFLYNKDYPDYLLYGGIGSVVGHELAHAFGNDSHKFNGAAQKREYRDRFQCLIRSYDQLIESEVGKLGRRMGNSTANDNFADIVGTSAAFRAYRASVARSQRSGREPQMLPGQLLSTLTADQLFFIQDAQFHCSKAEKHIRLIIALYFKKHAPSKSRVNGKIMHSNDFARAFSCKPGDRMYLSDDQKCHFW